MKIISHSYLNRFGAFVNGDLILSGQEDNFLKQYFVQLEIDYPKFYKMDSLSKSAFLGDFLLKNTLQNMVNIDEKLQLIFANSTSSQQTDLKFIESYTFKKNPSPSLFVYTLPNILAGEIAIKHKWYGENIFFILTKFDSKFFIDQIEMSFLRGNEYCMCGWIEMNGLEEEECFMFVVSKTVHWVENQEASNELNQILNNYRNNGIKRTIKSSNN